MAHSQLAKVGHIQYILALLSISINKADSISLTAMLFYSDYSRQKSRSRANSPIQTRLFLEQNP